VRGLRSWVGFRQTGMEYERAARHAGSPKYTLKSLVKLAFDGIFSFSYLPLRLSTTLGLAVSALGLLYAAFVVLARVLGAYQQIPGWTTVVVAVLVLGGVQLMMLGLVGEYMGRVYDEIKGRPSYLVDELIGFDDPPRRTE
jgi:dolichol-phosphate mannosyltransferase